MFIALRQWLVFTMVPRIVLRIALLLVISIVRHDAAPVSSETQAMMYLARYGYIDPAMQNPQSAALISGETVKRAIVDFQAFAGLNQTGIMDAETSKWMSMPRCGVVDRVGPGASARKKRYALQGSRWRVKELTYSITKYPSKLKSTDVDRELAKAFEVWADVTELTFVQLRSGAKVHIEIRFEEGEHGDGDAFDGRGGTLAHAYFPIYGGDAHFDEAETWTINSYKGTNLFQVAAHEFGHSLGLSHSDVRSALMAPFYRGYEPNFKLDNDDIIAVQQLYGKRKTSVIPTEQPKSIRPKDPILPPGGTSYNELCSDGKFDTIFTGSDSKTYIFKGDKYWKLSDDGNSISSGYPRYIKSMWDGLPANIDAAFTWTNGRTYFFKGSRYWRYTNFNLDSGYPKELSEGFAGVPSNVDTALVWSGNGKIYFFKGNKYWRFDPSQNPPIKSTYPKDISNWEGIPNNIDSAFQFTNGYSYFFKNGQYWRFNDRSFKVDEIVPPYPRSASTWWFGCSDVKSSRTNGGLSAHERPHADDEDADLVDAGYDDQPDNDVDDAVVFDEPSHRRKHVTVAGFHGSSGASAPSGAISFAAVACLLALLVHRFTNAL